MTIEYILYILVNCTTNDNCLAKETTTMEQSIGSPTSTSHHVNGITC